MRAKITSKDPYLVGRRKRGGKRRRASGMSIQGSPEWKEKISKGVIIGWSKKSPKDRIRSPLHHLKTKLRRTREYKSWKNQV